MKKTITTICLFCISFFGFSQTYVLMDSLFNVVTGTIMDINMPANTTNITEILVKNTAATTDTFKVHRTVMNIDALDQTQFCWGGLCYGSTTNTSNLSLACPYNDTIDFLGNGVHAVFVAGPECVTRLVHYNFFNIHNPADTAGVTLRYLCTTAGINEHSDQLGSVSAAFPNPITSSSSIKYKLEENAKQGKLIFYDVLGKVIKQIVLSGKEGTEKISTNDFDAGIYFYTFLVDDKIISTKKLVISSK